MWQENKSNEINNSFYIIKKQNVTLICDTLQYYLVIRKQLVFLYIKKKNVEGKKGIPPEGNTLYFVM